MKVDVIIPIYHPGEKFVKLMHALKKQTVSVNRVILIHTCDDVQNDRKILQQLNINYENVDVYPVKKEEFDHGRSRNFGAKQSNAEICIFMTQDAVPKDAFLIENLTGALENKKVACAYARQLADENSTEVEKMTRLFNYPDKDQIKSNKNLSQMGIKTFFCSNVCCAYNMDIFHKIGGFINHTIFNEDMIYAGVAVQKGYSVAYVSKACVIHSHNYTGKQQFRRNFDLGVSQAEHPEIFQCVSSEKEGMKMVRKILGLLKASGNYREMAVYIYQSGCKYIGYRMGKMYRALPEFIIRKCTMSPLYFQK